MITTHSYLIGGTSGTFKCYFYLLLADHYDGQRIHTAGYLPLLKRLARNLGGDGALFTPFEGDEERTKNEAEAKQWNAPGGNEISQMPGLLLTSVPFATFNPSDCEWAYLRLRDSEGNVANGHEYEELFARMADTVRQGDNVIAKLQEAIRKHRLPGTGEVFELSKPEMFGCSINLIAAKAVLASTLRAATGQRTT